MSLESDGGMILTGENRKTRRNTCLSATLSTTNPTWIDQGANPGLRGERPATNDLSLGYGQNNDLLSEHVKRNKYYSLISRQRFLVADICVKLDISKFKKK
jgi:hypothetical protein